MFKKCYGKMASPEKNKTVMKIINSPKNPIIMKVIKLVFFFPNIL